PPTHEKVDPVLVVRETDLHLHLLAAGYTTVEYPAIFDNAMHVAMVDVTYRPGEFAAHHVMGQISRQTQVGKAVEQLHREEQIGGHAIPMRLDMHGNLRVVREPPPALDIGYAFLDRVGPHIGLQVDVIRSQLLHVL